MLKGILVKTTGDVEVVEYEDTLETLQKYVNGLIEYVTIGDGVDMIINDEGKILGMKPNWVATFLYQHDMIVGDALIVGVNAEGENISLTEQQIVDIYRNIEN